MLNDVKKNVKRFGRYVLDTPSFITYAIIFHILCYNISEILIKKKLLKCLDIKWAYHLNTFVQNCAPVIFYFFALILVKNV